MKEVNKFKYSFFFKDIDLVPKGRPVTIPVKNPYYNKNGKLISSRTFTPSRSRKCEQELKKRFKISMINRKILEDDLNVVIYISVTHNRGDIDNYIKTVLDSMNGIVITDDKKVIQIAAKIERKADISFLSVGVEEHE